MFELKDSGELLAVSYAINFIRFENKDYGSKHLITSKILVDLHIRIMVEANKYAKSKGVDILDEFPYIEDYSEHLDVIASHIEHIDNWLDFTMEKKNDIIKLLISPYKFSDSTLENLLSSGDRFHNELSGK